MNLSQVSRTAILTLICRVVASEKENALFNDPIAALCLDRLISIASAEEKRWIIGRKRWYGGISAHDAMSGARRAKNFDEITNRYIAANPGCTVINLGCGFDTRFWRIANQKCRYFEVDLPELVSLKRDILQDRIGYNLIGCSVLDYSWIDEVIANGSNRFLLLAEGLLMYFPKPDVIQLFQRLGQKFVDSQFAFDVVPDKWVKGPGKILLRLETKINWRLDASWTSGIKNPSEIESYGPGLKVIKKTKGSSGPVIIVAINAANAAL